MEIELYSKMQNPLEAITQVGKIFARSGMFGCDREEQGQLLAMICLAEKKSPVEITRTYDIIGGKLRKKAMAAFAEFRGRGGKVKWISTGDAGDKAEADFTFEGQTIRASFTIDQAKKQQLIKPNSNWEKTPGNMLRARCISNAIGMLCPEILAGEDVDESPAPPAPALTLPVQPSVTVEVSAPATATATAPQAESVAAIPVQSEVVQVAPAQFQSGPKLTTQPTGGLSADLVQQVENAIGEHAIIAVNWFVKEGWLKAGQPLSALTEARAKRIINQRESFIRAITPAAKEGGAQ